MKNKTSLRNGDWGFYPTDSKITGEKLDHNGAYTFAEGEATNHFHTVKVKEKEDMEFYKQPDGSYLVVLKSEGTVTHPEHSLKTDLIVPPGTYKLRQLREKDWFSLTTRRIID